MTCGLGRAAPADVLVVAAPGAETTGRLLTDELEAVGLSVKRTTGSEEQAAAQAARGQHRAVVWLDDGKGARIWLEDEPEAEPHQVEPSDSSQLLALRTAEHLRGRLLPGQDASGAAAPSEAAARGGADDGAPRTLPEPRFSILGGPGVIASSYAEPLPAFSLGFMYRPWTKVSIGAFGTGSLAQNAWLADTTLSTSQFSIGGRLAVRWLDPPAKSFHSDLLFRTAARQLRVRSDAGGPMGKATATIWGPTFDVGLDGTWELTRWFSLGAELCFILGLPLGHSVAKNDGMPAPQAAPELTATESTDPDFQVVTSFLAVATW